MSRRSRRRQGNSKGRGSWWVRALMVLGFVVLIGTIGGYIWLRSWLHSDDFRVMLSNAAGEGLEAQSEFGAFRWDGTSVATDSFRAQGDGLVKEIEAEALGLEIGLSKVRQGIVEVRQAKLGRIDVTLDLTKTDEADQDVVEAESELAAEEFVEEREAWYAGLLPDEVLLTDLEIVRSALVLELAEGEASFRGTHWAAASTAGGKGYEVEADGGEIKLPWDGVPPLAMDRARFRFQDLTVFLTEAVFRVYETGRLQLAGEASLDGEGFGFAGSLDDIMASEVLPEDWKQRLEGELVSNFTISDPGEGGELKVDGSVEVLNGTLTALPMLDHLAAYGGNPRFRRLSLNDARTDFRFEDGVLEIRGLELGSDGLIRLEGRLTVDQVDRLDGLLRLGLAPGTLARIPGAETKVFRPGKDGLLWTPLRISGTVDDPEEDLSDRLFEAAGERMFELLPETGEQVLRFTQNVANGDLDGAIDEGRQVFEQGSDLVDAGKLLLEGEGDPIEQADEILRQGEEVVRGVESLFDSIRGKREPEDTEREQPSE